MKKWVWLVGTIGSAVSLGLEWVDHIFHVVHFLTEERLEVLAGVSFIIFMISFFMEMRNKIEEQREKIAADARHYQEDIIGIVESAKVDVVRKLLGIKIGKDIMDLLLPVDATFPLTLVPGGDVALTVNQQEYANILQRCVIHLGRKEGWSVDWTTFVPFESLNRALANSPEQWTRRFPDGWQTNGPNLNYVCQHNSRYYTGISHWASILRPRQIIILANPTSHPQHPLNWHKYATPMAHGGFRGGAYNADLLKYVMARYGVKTYADFIEWSEADFAAHRTLAQDADRIHDHVKWHGLEERQLEQKVPSFEKLYNLDFVKFRSDSGSAFALVRIDPENYVEVNGGIPGITFIVYTSVMVSFYSDLFDIMWNDSKRTFRELTGLQM
jgi:hypothetical protein